MNVFGRWIYPHIPEAACHPDKRWRCWRWDNCDGFPLQGDVQYSICLSLPDSTQPRRDEELCPRGLLWMRSLSRCLAVLLTRFFPGPLLFHRPIIELQCPNRAVFCRQMQGAAWGFHQHLHFVITVIAALLLTSNSVLCVLSHETSAPKYAN